MANQHKPNPPWEIIESEVERLWKMRKNDKEILEHLLTNVIDTEKYGLGLNNFRKLRQDNGLERARRQKHTLTSIRNAVQALREHFPLAGAREMTSLLFHECKMSVPRNLVVKYFHAYEPQLVRQRKARRLKRRRFWAAGVNDIWALDQHDKWKRFGLALHVSEDPFAGVLQWLQVWHNNNNPKRIAGYFLDRVEVFGYSPLITQSDLGSENYGVANAQSVLRQWNDPRLKGTVQHRWMRSKKNVKPEIAWSQFRRRFAPGFEKIFEKGVIAGWYDTTRPLDVLVFRWLFIPWIQTELDAYVERINNTRKRADRNKVLPHGVPNDIYNNPERYGCLDFKVKVDPEAIKYCREKFAPPDDPVFELVPPIFAQYANQIYMQMGSPELDSGNIWEIYCYIVEQLQDITRRRASEDDNYFEAVDEWQVSEFLQDNESQEEAVPLLPLIQGQSLFGGYDDPRPDGSLYFGGVNEGRGLDTALEARLDDMEDDDEFEVEEFYEEGEGITFSEDEHGEEEERDEW